MNKKLTATILLGITIFSSFNIESKPNKSNIEKQTQESKDNTSKKENRESQIQDFFDPNLDQDLKVDNVFENPSKLKIWIREFGIGLLCKYYIAKAWLKTRLQNIFRFIK